MVVVRSGLPLGRRVDSTLTEDGSLGKVDDRGSEERTEDTAVGDSEGSSGHVLHGELSVTSLARRDRDGRGRFSSRSVRHVGAGMHLLAKVGDSLLNLDETHCLDVADDRGDKTLGG